MKKMKDDGTWQYLMLKEDNALETLVKTLIVVLRSPPAAPDVPPHQQEDGHQDR